MKKITFVIFAFLLSFSGFAQLPTETFEGTWTPGSGPAGWSIINVAGPAQTWQQGNGGAAQPAYQGTKAAFLNRETVAAGELTEDWLITPGFTVPTNAQLHFFSRLTQNIDQGSLYKVMIGTDPLDTASFTELQNWTELTLNPVQQEYIEKIVDIPAAQSGTTRYIAFVMRGNNGDRWLVDNVSVFQQCFTPTGLTATGITATSATLGWANPAGSTSWEIEILPATSSPTGTGTVVTTNPYTTTTLDASTSYVFYVRSLCSPDGNNSAWAGPFSFSTTQVPADLNFSTNFETANNGFTIVNGTQTNKWTIGTATSNSPTHSLYITNDDGVTNAYTNNVTSRVHAYRDINIPVGAVEMNLSFDWKNLGENGFDFIRVWNVPSTFVPAAGTAITANATRLQIGGNFVGNSNWSTSSTNLNVAAFAGTTRRFVFEWTNDGSVGTNPPGALDNIGFTLITCSQPTALTVSNITQTGATLGWTNVGTATSWEVYAVPAGDPAPTASSVGTVVSTNPYVLTGLTNTTGYKFYVRAICGPTDKSLWSGPLNFSTTQIPATLNYSNDLETNNGFTFVNGTQTNQWFYGTATSNSPTHSLYITNDAGVSNAYTNNATSVVQAYRDIAFPAGTGDVNLSFDWKNLGETGFDFLRVWVAPVTYNPVAGTQTTILNSGGIQLGANFVGNANWSTFTNTFNATAFAGTTVRLIFEWRNDNIIGTNPPAAVDNINVTAITCSQPSALTVSNLTQNSATLGWTNAGTATSWEVLVVPAGSPAPTPATTGVIVSANPYVATGLTPGTAYTFYVRSVCGPTDVSFWTGPLNFSTTQVPATLNYAQDFETDNGFTFVNGTQTNKWFYGTAVSNSPTHSLYITNDNGVTNNYTNNATSVVQAYRDITVPAGTTDVNFSFDWRNLGETGFDFIRVWAVPVTYTPTAGVQTTPGLAGAGAIQFGANFVGNANWSTFNQIFNASAFAGGTMRLVFEWRNDGIIGTNPAGAIDNVNLSIITCPQPTALTVTNVTETGATVGWTNQGTATSWEVFLVPANDPAPTASSVGTIVTTNPYVATGLNNSTGYKVYVRAVCSPTDSSLWTGPVFFSTLQVPATLNYTNDFETNNGFTFVNGTQTNQWFYGTAVSSSPTHSIYISNNAGVTNTYTTNAISTVQAYRDFTIPAGTTDVNLGFDWHNQGENGFDFIRVWAVPVTYTPVAGTQTTVANSGGGVMLAGPLVGNANWTTFNQIFNASAFAGSTMRLVYEWRNDGSVGTNPPGAIDNVNLTIITCPQPTAIVVTNPTDTQATIGWTNQGTATSWEVYVVPATDPAPTASSVGVITTDNPYTATGLTSGTLYKVYVRAVCSPTDKSLWTGPVNFNTTICLPTAQCNYNFILTDSFGDGWNGNTMSVIQNGIVVGTLTLPSGSGPLTIPVALCDGLSFSLVWNTGGAFAGEVGIAIQDPFGDDLFSHPAPGTNLQGTTLFSGVAGCTPPPCPKPVNLDILCLTADGVTITWDSPDTVTQWEVVLQPAADPAPTSGTVVNQPSYTSGPLTPGVAYTFYVRTVCPDGSGFSTWATINFNGPVVSVGDAQALCAGVLSVPQESNSGGTVPPYGTVGCLGSTPNPTWYYVTLSEDGPVTLQLSQLADGSGNPIDVDFAAFGPFESKLEACSLLGSPPNTAYIVDCSFSASAFEQIDINGAAGDVFALLVTNFNGSPGSVTITQSAGADLSCNPTVSLGLDQVLCGTDTYNLTATVDNPGAPQVYTYQWFMDADPITPTIDETTNDSQTIVVDEPGSHVYSVIVTMPLPPSPDPVTDQVTIALSPAFTVPVPTPIVLCGTGGTADVDLTAINFLGSLDPTLYEVVGVYPTLSGANTNTGAITTVPYTASTGILYVTVRDILVPTCFHVVQLQITVNTAPTGTIAYATPVCTTSTSLPVTQTGNAGGAYTSTTGLSIDAVTGTINPSLSTPGTYVVTYTVAATPTCPEFTTTTSVEIVAPPVVTISYDASPYCNSAGTATVTLTGLAGGTYTSTTGLVISATTGEVDLVASTPGDYVVTYTVAGPAPCDAVVVTTNITINESLSATFDYGAPSFCTSNGVAPVTLTGDAGGTYSSTTGLIIDPVTGEITPADSTPGTYDVIYTIPANGSCAEFVSLPVTVIILEQPVVTISYDASPYCNSAGTATVTLTGPAGGTYSSTAGLALNPSTGEVDLVASTAGTYTVNYDVAIAAPCQAATASTEIVINESFTAVIDYGTTPFCTNGGTATVTLTGDANGTYSSTAGLIIDPATGEITLSGSTPGSYDVVYTIPANGSCLEFVSAPTTVVIEAAPTATYSYDNTPYCSNGGTATITFSGTTGGTFTSTAGLSINAATGEVDLANSTPGTYDVIYNVPATAACAAQPFPATQITITLLPVADITYTATPYCSDSGIATITNVSSNLTGTYTATPSGLSLNPATGAVDAAFSTAGTYTVTYTIPAAAGCDAVTDTATITITTLPIADFDYEFTTFCTDYATLTPIAVGGGVLGTFTVDVPGLDITAAGVINPANSTEGTYVITNTVTPANGCTPAPVSVTVNVISNPLADAPANVVSCDEYVLPALTNGNYYTGDNGTGTQLAVNTVITDDQRVYVYATNGVCSTQNFFDIDIVPTPLLSIEVPITTECDQMDFVLTAVFALDETIYTPDDVTYEWTNLTTGLSAGTGESIIITEAGTYEVTVTPNSGSVCAATAEIVIDNVFCDVQRGISPNADGMNDAFDLSNLDVRKLRIYNRYGEEVYHFNGAYTNQWGGNTDKGDELPTGTYFYMFERTTGEAKTGWIYINRQE
jgi:gliding motility-associated-like protein